MLFNNILRILKSYRFSLVRIIFYELVFLLRGYKGNRISFSKNSVMSDNIPCPYYFLIKINETLEKRDFEVMLDLGCGSGRAINFFNRTLLNKSFIGIEYFYEQYNYCKKIFKKQANIKLLQNDFTNCDFLQYDADCYFFNEPIQDDIIFIKIIKKIINLSSKRKNILLIFVNCNKTVLETLQNIKCIDSYYVGNSRGYSIYSFERK